MKPRFYSLLLGASLLLVMPVQAGARQNLTTLREQAATWLEQQAVKAYPGSQARIQVGMIDERLRLPACPEPQFFLPDGARLWANGSVGARCAGEIKWRLYLTYESHLRGPGLVASRSLPARSIPGPGDVELKLLDYAQSPDRYLRVLPSGARLLRPLAPGEAILADGLSLPDVIQAGRKVQVLATGAGFSVTQEGTALNSAAQGEPVKVKMPSGRIVQGIATQDGRVLVSP